MSVKQASSAADRDELRTHYRIVLDFIKKERGMRDRVLAEVHAAKVSLAVIGAVVGSAILYPTISVAAR